MPNWYEATWPADEAVVGVFEVVGQRRARLDLVLGHPVDHHLDRLDHLGRGPVIGAPVWRPEVRPVEPVPGELIEARDAGAGARARNWCQPQTLTVDSSKPASVGWRPWASTTTFWQASVNCFQVLISAMFTPALSNMLLRYSSMSPNSSSGAMNFLPS